MIDFDSLKREAEAFSVEITAEMAERFDLYAHLLVEKNKVMNLTGITEPSAIVTRHFADSLSFFTLASPNKGDSLIDVGSGAGFPGLAIKIVREDMNITLLDGTKKRVDFLSDVASRLGFNVNCVHARAEEYAKNNRELFDFATARAVSEMRTLAEYCLPFVKAGGSFVALKGKEIKEELDLSANALSVLGGKVEKTLHLKLADESERNLVLIKKISQTPSKYPRVSAQIAKKPL